jgi:hypothetical protein
MPDGTFELEANRSLRINLGGKGQMRWAELAPGKAARHEKFAFRNGAITLDVNPTICLGAEGGAIAEGARIRAQPCEAGAEHQQFIMNRDGRIRASSQHICMSAREGAMSLGSEIVLGACAGDASAFAHRGGKLSFRKPQRADLHFNIQGGSMDGAVVLWKSEPAHSDQFEWSEAGQLRLKSRNQTCLIAQQGIVQGSQIIGWPCKAEGEEPTPNELFGYDQARSVIYAKADPELVFNAKGGKMAPGDHIVLWAGKVERKRPTASGGSQEL